MRLVLYSKPGCHLCEDVRRDLSRLTSGGLDLTVEERDITTNPEWDRRFRYLIPVVESADGRCLEAPITTEALERFVASA